MVLMALSASGTWSSAEQMLKWILGNYVIFSICLDLSDLEASLFVQFYVSCDGRFDGAVVPIFQRAAGDVTDVP